jgi:hypothetical protein
MTDKERYIELLKSTNREGVDELIKYLEGSDFFTAPASTKYHGSFEGGLCRHCLNVYDCLEGITKLHTKHVEGRITEDSIIIVSLLHDLSKVDFYELYDRNVKVDGQWVQQRCYKIRDDKFIYGNHEETSLFVAQQFVSLSIEEQVAILHHMGGLAYDSVKEDLNEVFHTYPLAMLLHVADSLAAQFYC